MCFMLISLLIIFINQINGTKQSNIDDFIDQLLASENFGKMTDIIARKAADKINIHLSQQNTKNSYLDDDYFRARKDGNEFEATDSKETPINALVTNKNPVKSKLSLKYRLFTKDINKKSNNNISSQINKAQDSTDDKLNGTKHSKDNITLNQETDYSAEDKNVDNNNKYVISKESVKGAHIQTLDNQSRSLFNKSDKERKTKGIIFPKKITTVDLINNNAIIKQRDTDRVFVLQTSSDYEEYHREVNRTRKEDLNAEI